MLYTPSTLLHRLCAFVFAVLAIWSADERPMFAAVSLVLCVLCWAEGRTFANVHVHLGPNDAATLDGVPVAEGTHR